MPRRHRVELDRCACCLLPATEKRTVVVGESRQPCGQAGYLKRVFGTCEIHKEVAERTFRILAGVKFQRRTEPAITN